MDTKKKKYMIPTWIKVYRDRNDRDYLEKLSDLLTIDSLKQTADIALENGLNSKEKGYPEEKLKRITIKFSGLSSLSLLGGSEKETIVSAEFRKLLESTKEIEEAGYYLDIQFLFSYPYSDFNYNLVLCEQSRQDGDTVDCLQNGKKYKLGYTVPGKPSNKTLLLSNTFHHLRNSLIKLQSYVIAANDEKHAFNTKKAKNRITIKFTPVNIMTCFLKINNQIFIDPYTYSKDNSHSKSLNLSSPLTHIQLDSEKAWHAANKKKGVIKKETKLYVEHKNHFLSLIGHFRYLWHHPLTIPAHDATKLIRNNFETLCEIKTPFSINFFGKADMIRKEMNKSNRKNLSETEKSVYQIPKYGEIDAWAQYIKNEFLKHCSKFSFGAAQGADSKPSKAAPPEKVPIFIVGSWRKGDINNYMKIVKDFFEDPVKFTRALKKRVMEEFDLEEYVESYIHYLKHITAAGKFTGYEERKKIINHFFRALDQYCLFALNNTASLKKFCSVLAGFVYCEKKAPLINASELDILFTSSLCTEIRKILKNKTAKKKNNIIDEIQAYYLPKIEDALVTNTETDISGLGFKPIVVDADDSEDITKIIYKNLNESQLGFIIQTNDITDLSYINDIRENLYRKNTTSRKYNLKGLPVDEIINEVVNIIREDFYSKPNVYLEKGFLMGKLGKRLNRHGKMTEAVCVFSEVNSHKESNNIHLANTTFLNSREFELELYRALKWAWNITAMNSPYCLHILDHFKQLVEFKETFQKLYFLVQGLQPQLKKNNQKLSDKFSRTIITKDDINISYNRHSSKLASYINEVSRWRDDFEKRLHHNLSYEPKQNN